MPIDEATRKEYATKAANAHGTTTIKVGDAEATEAEEGATVTVIVTPQEGYIVAEQDNVLLICKKGDSSSLVRKYVSEVQIKYGEEFV